MAAACMRSVKCTVQSLGARENILWRGRLSRKNSDFFNQLINIFLFPKDMKSYCGFQALIRRPAPELYIFQRPRRRDAR